MIAYKLLRVRKDGTLGSLFIDRKKVIEIGVWLKSESHQTKGYKYRPYFHCTSKPTAPHLSEKGRKWFVVKIDDFMEMERPKSQGGKWFLSKKMKVIKLS